MNSLEVITSLHKSPRLTCSILSTGHSITWPTWMSGTVSIEQDCCLHNPISCKHGHQAVEPLQSDIPSLHLTLALTQPKLNQKFGILHRIELDLNISHQSQNADTAKIEPNFWTNTLLYDARTSICWDKSTFDALTPLCDARTSICESVYWIIEWFVIQSVSLDRQKIMVSIQHCSPHTVSCRHGCQSAWLSKSDSLTLVLPEWPC